MTSVRLSLLCFCDEIASRGQRRVVERSRRTFNSDMFWVLFFLARRRLIGNRTHNDKDSPTMDYDCWPNISSGSFAFLPRQTIENTLFHPARAFRGDSHTSTIATEWISLMTQTRAAFLNNACNVRLFVSSIRFFFDKLQLCNSFALCLRLHKEMKCKKLSRTPPNKANVTRVIIVSFFYFGFTMDWKMCVGFGCVGGFLCWDKWKFVECFMFIRWGCWMVDLYCAIIV